MPRRRPLLHPAPRATRPAPRAVRPAPRATRPAPRVGRAAAAAALLLVSLAPGAARAQVNAEALRATLKQNPRFLWLEAALVGHSGNTQTLTFSGSAFGGLTYGHQIVFVKATADYGQALGVTNVARWMTHARYTYDATERFSLEGFAQAQHDRFRRIVVRDLYGAGVRFSFVKTKEQDLFVGTSYMLEHETIGALGDGSASGRENEVWNRSSSYFGVNAKISPLVDASSVTYFQPRIDVPKDFRLLSESWLSVQITKVLAAKVSGTLWYDNEPPLGVKTYDLEVKNSLVLKLQ